MPSVYFSRINKMNSVGRWARGVDCVLSGAGDRDQIHSLTYWLVKTAATQKSQAFHQTCNLLEFSKPNVFEWLFIFINFWLSVQFLFLFCSNLKRRDYKFVSLNGSEDALKLLFFLKFHYIILLIISNSMVIK